MGIVKDIFGGSSSKSYNKAYDQVQGQVQPYVQRGQQAGNAMADLLGLGGGQPSRGTQGSIERQVGPGGQSPLAGAGAGLGGAAGAAAAGVPGGMPQINQGGGGQGGAPGGGAGGAFENYLNSTGYQFQMDQGIDAIEGSQAAKGMLRSGDTLKGITEFGQGMGRKYFENYLNRLQGLSQMGLQGTGTLAQAGQVSESESSSGGAGKAIGKGLSAIALSDGRAKHIGSLIETLPNGIEVRRFRFRGDEKEHIGVVAQQVQPIMPEAVMEIDGLLHVDYGAVFGE